jgi:gamma-F420-2:alpha-L-glutamate ligase
MNKGVIIYNLINENNLDWTKQVDRFVNAFGKLNIELTKINNADAYKYIKENKGKLDFVLFWDKDSYLADAIEKLDIKMFNSAEAIRICDDKALTYTALMKAGIKTPNTLVLPFTFGNNVLKYFDIINKMIISSNINYPFVVKERFGSFGDQVYLVHNEGEFILLLQQVGEKPLLVQEYLDFSFGKDLRVNIVGNKVLSSVLRINKQNFRSNVHQGGRMEVVRGISKVVKDSALGASKACRCTFSGVDIVIDKDGNPYVLEVNSNARTIAVEQYTNISITDKIAEFIAKQ